MDSVVVPKPFRWDSSFEVFYKSLDEQHRGLFDALAAVAENLGDDAVLKTLVDLTTAHFSYEEGKMQDAKYENYPEHKKKHDGFLADLAGSKKPNTTDNCNWAMKWLCHHIKTVDFVYKGKLKAEK
uniref:Hemerythrin n=1 Tax=Naineris laevigata TaxID=645996 RepID=A0A1S6QD11_9ANNE|nr:hemerythrin [Naineris laevigata]